MKPQLPDIQKTLRRLPKISAPGEFEKQLHERLNSTRREELAPLTRTGAITPLQYSIAASVAIMLLAGYIVTRLYLIGIPAPVSVSDETVAESGRPQIESSSPENNSIVPDKARLKAAQATTTSEKRPVERKAETVTSQTRRRTSANTEATSSQYNTPPNEGISTNQPDNQTAPATTMFPNLQKATIGYPSGVNRARAPRGFQEGISSFGAPLFMDSLARKYIADSLSLADSLHKDSTRLNSHKSGNKTHLPNNQSPRR